MENGVHTQTFDNYLSFFQGSRSALFSIGCGGASLSPVVAGYLFTNAGPTSIWWFNVAVAARQVIYI